MDRKQAFMAAAAAGVLAYAYVATKEDVLYSCSREFGHAQVVNPDRYFPLRSRYVRLVPHNGEAKEYTYAGLSLRGGPKAALMAEAAQLCQTGKPSPKLRQR